MRRSTKQSSSAGSEEQQFGQKLKRNSDQQKQNYDNTDKLADSTKSTQQLQKMIIAGISEYNQPIQEDKSMSQLQEIEPEAKQLGPQDYQWRGKKTLILDLDETLVHSSFQPMSNSDYTLAIKVQNIPFTIHVKKRPGVEFFLEQVSQYFEVVIYTASLAEYADPVCDLIDPKKLVAARLFRESCTNYQGLFVKDLSKIGRDLKDLLIVDNSETSFLFQPENAIQISNYFQNDTDRELFRLLPFLQFLSNVKDVRTTKGWMEKYLTQDIIEYMSVTGKMQQFNKKLQLRKQRNLMKQQQQQQEGSGSQIPLLNKASSSKEDIIKETNSTTNLVNNNTQRYKDGSKSPDTQILELNININKQNEEIDDKISNNNRSNSKEDSLTGKVSNASTTDVAITATTANITNKIDKQKQQQQQQQQELKQQQIQQLPHQQKFKKDLVIQVPSEKEKNEEEIMELSQVQLIEEFNSLSSSKIMKPSMSNLNSVRTNKLESTRKLIEKSIPPMGNYQEDYFIHKTCPDEEKNNNNNNFYQLPSSKNYNNKQNINEMDNNNNNNNNNNNPQRLNRSFENIRYDIGSLNLNSPVAQQDFINFLKEPISTSPKLHHISNYFSSNGQNLKNSIPQSNKYCDQLKLKQLMQQTQLIEEEVALQEQSDCNRLPPDQIILDRNHTKSALDGFKSKQRILQSPGIEITDEDDNADKQEEQQQQLCLSASSLSNQQQQQQLVLLQSQQL